MENHLPVEHEEMHTEEHTDDDSTEDLVDKFARCTVIFSTEDRRKNSMDRELVMIKNIKPLQDNTIDWKRITELTFAQKMMEIWFSETLITTEYRAFIFNGHLFGNYGWIPPTRDEAQHSADLSVDERFGTAYWRLLSPKKTELQPFFKQLFNHYIGALKFYKISCLSESKEDVKLYDQLEALIKKLDSPSYQCGVIKCLEGLSFRREEDIKWNDHPNWFVFENEIFDLVTMETVQASPHHHINVSCGHDRESPDYLLNYASAVKDIEEFMYSITGADEDLITYMMKIMSSFLVQGNIEEKCFFLLGAGRNGKGKFL